ncbi:ribonuclease 1-like isoform X2 [Varroa destructor]|uniref:Secreted protein n=1 Tax=Varroa destructor TaxID=109461 RepID=A0A7M7M476_VARDE|nr:ribonuclease 1-like isoform X2 [Varroa destructor]
MSRNELFWLRCITLSMVLFLVVNKAWGMDVLGFGAQTHFWKEDVQPAVTLVMTWLPGVCTTPTHEISSKPPCRIEALRPFWTIKELRGTLRDFPHSLRPQLYRMWPAVFEPSSSYIEFWAAHYRRDGTCFDRYSLLGTPVRFFQTALYLAQRLDLMIDLMKAKYVPSIHPYETRRFEEALQTIHGARVRLRCPRPNNFLEEVEFCMDHELKPRDCRRTFFKAECGNHVYYPPPPPGGDQIYPYEYSVVPDQAQVSRLASCKTIGGSGKSSAAENFYDELFGEDDKDNYGDLSARF